jgi:cation diffusion facilitator family transporter
MTEVFKKGQKATIISALLTILLAVVKGVIGLISGSVVLVGDAVHSAADSLSSFAAWFGLKVSQKRPTEKFSYGYYKAENLTAFLISGLIILAGLLIVKESISKFCLEPGLNIPLIAVGAAVLDALVMFSIGSYEMKIGQKINSQSLIADGRESRLHLLSSSLVLIGILAGWFKIPYLEGVMGLLISLFIFQAGISSAKDSVFALMDVSPEKDKEEKVKKILRSISGVRGFDNLKLRKSGPFIFGEVEVKIGKTIDVKRAYEISENIEKEIRKGIKSIDSFTVAVSPFEVEKQKICIPIKNDEGVDSLMFNHFGRAEKFIFINLEKSKIKDYYVKENPHQEKEVRAGLNTALFVIGEKIDSVITQEMGPISLHTLRDNIVDVYWASDGQVREIVEKFIQKKLKPLKKPTKEKL